MAKMVCGRLTIAHHLRVRPRFFESRFARVGCRRPMLAGGFEEIVAAVRQLPDFSWQPSVAAPEPRVGVMLHRSVVRPATKSLKASRASASSRPAATSCSTCRSQTAASYSANHFRNRASSFFGRRRTAPVILATVVIRKAYSRFPRLVQRVLGRSQINQDWQSRPHRDF